MIDLGEFWRFVSRLPGLSAVRAEWQGRLGQRGFHVLTRWFVGDGPARTYPHPDDGRALRVVPLSRGRLCAVCETTGTTVIADLPTDEARCLRVNLVQLRQDVAECLGLVEDHDPIRVPAKAFPVGTWSPVAGRAVPAFMLLAPTARAAAAEVGRLVLGARASFLLMAPVPLHLDSATRERMTESGGMLLPLNDVIRCAPDGRLEPSAAWETFKASYCQQFLPGLMAPAEPRYLFAKRGMWMVRFDGKLTVLDGGLKGAAFIHYLIRRPGREIPVVQVLADIAGAERPPVDMGAEGLSVASADTGELVDKQTIAACKREYESLSAEIAEARKNRDRGRVEQLEGRIGQIADYLSGALGLGSRARKGSNDVARIRKRIARVIGIAVEKIRESDPALAAHLQNSISTHSVMSYKPERPIDWAF